ncbi:hypothetical protein TCAL_15241 [Tigriopus californicus]|uniref:Uncharacterized protein n=1 Tax=Tigriopus californicus TaxID=6832 RepID=A0A553NEP0_TIGCA|nr:hypothetical protein TCAL_15241 [Tigriopus californicus]
MEGAGPPTPRTGPDKPGAAPPAPMGTPRPAARPMPGPPAPGMGTRGIPSSAGGGPSTVMDTMFSPRRRTNPRTRFSSRSADLADLDLSLRNSSQSPKMRFMCLSKALKVPMKKTGKTYRFWDHFVKHSQELSPMYGPKTDFNRFSSPHDGWLFHHKDNLDLHQRILKFEHGQAQDLEVRSHLNEGPGPFEANSPLEFLAQREKMKLLKDKMSKELTIEEDRHDRFKRKNLETIGKPRPYFPPWDHLAQEGPSRIKPRPKHRGWTHGDDSESWFLEAKTRGAHDDYMDFYQDRMDCHLRTPQAGNMALAY